MESTTNHFRKRPRDKHGWILMGLPNDLKECKRQLRLTEMFGPKENEKPLRKQIEDLTKQEGEK